MKTLSTMYIRRIWEIIGFSKLHLIMTKIYLIVLSLLIKCNKLIKNQKKIQEKSEKSTEN